MTSEAKIASNRKNAQKSCGPKSAEGKRASRFNALKHGLTAQLAMLPDEEPAELEALRVSWIDRYRPRNGFEVALVERGVYLAWQLERVERAQWAQLCFHAQTAAGAKQEREVQETIDLALRLLRPTWEYRWGATDEAKTAAASAALVSEEAVHPAILGGRLEKMGDGCRWLRQQWSELKAILDEGRAWQAIECFKATRLLGMQPVSMVDLPELARFLRICQALAGEGIELATETWKLLAPTDAEGGFRQFCILLASEPAPLDALAARQELSAIVQQQLERLDEKIESLDEISELEAELGPHRYAFDFSDDGERMRRYELACRRFVDRIKDELTKRPCRGADQYVPAYGGYPSLRPSLRNLGGGRSASALTTGASNGEAAAPQRNEANGPGEADSALIEKAVAPQRNEANGPGDADSAVIEEAVAPKRNEANGPGDADSALIEEAVAPQRNEANGAGLAATKSGAAMGGAAGQAESLSAPVGAIRRHQVGGATVTRLSQAIGLQGTKPASRRARLAQLRELARRGTVV